VKSGARFQVKPVFHIVSIRHFLIVKLLHMYQHFDHGLSNIIAQDNMLFQQSFERIIGLFVTEFSRSQLINIHEKIGTREKSPDNWIVRIIEVWIIEVRLYLCKSRGTHLAQNPSIMLKPNFCKTTTPQGSYFNRIVKLWNLICTVAPFSCVSIVSTFKTFVTKFYFSLLSSITWNTELKGSSCSVLWWC